MFIPSHLTLHAAREYLKEVLVLLDLPETSRNTLLLATAALPQMSAGWGFSTAQKRAREGWLLLHDAFANAGMLGQASDAASRIRAIDELRPPGPGYYALGGLGLIGAGFGLFRILKGK